MRQHGTWASGESERGNFAQVSDDRITAAGRVLVVDDSDDVRRLLRMYLRATGAEVVEARDGRAACDLAFAAQNARRDFDLILLDMEMPELDGYAAATMLRLQGFVGPVIALTANDDAGEAARCVASGCNEYLRKPVGREVLTRAVAGHLAGRRGRSGPAAETSAAAVSPRGADNAACEPALEPFLREFLASLPGYVRVLEEQLRGHAVAQLAQTVHQIKGAAGMYGFDRMYDVAASAEGVARAAARDPLADGRRLAGEIDALIGEIRGTCGVPQKRTEGDVAGG